MYTARNMHTHKANSIILQSLNVKTTVYSATFEIKNCIDGFWCKDQDNSSLLQKLTICHLKINSIFSTNMFYFVQLNIYAKKNENQ